MAPSTLGETVYELFQADLDLLAIGVVDAAGTPVGLVERGHLTLKFGSNYGRALHAGRAVSLLMDPSPLVADADMEVADFAQTALAHRPSDLMRGFIVLSEGRVIGIGSMLALFQAITAENALSSRRLSQTNAGLKCAEEKATSAHALLAEALDAMGEGVAIFDAWDRVVLWNSKYAQSHQASAEILVPGVPFETLLQHGVAACEYVDAIGREAQWLSERLRRRARMGDRTSEEQELSNGQWLRIEDTRLVDGGCISVAVDITDIRRREASFRLLFESNPVPLAVFDRRDLTLLAANEAARVRYGYDRTAVGRLRADEILAEDEREAARALRLGVTDRVYAGERSWTFVTASGERHAVLPYMHPLTWEGRLATLAAAVDISLQHEAEAALKAALQVAEDADRSKSEFLANTSHELRTPLNGIIGMASVLARTALDATQVEMVEVIQTSGATLQTLLSDVLDLAKIEAGQIDLQSEPVVPASLARHVAKLFEAAAAAKGLDLTLDLDTGSEAPVLADSVRLTQILTNLCSNAVKFTECGGVRLTIRGFEQDGRRHLAVVVADTGIGMSPEARARVFDRFAQADGSITRRFGGTGLGLSISQHLSQLMGGRIEVESSPGRGSTFRLTFGFPAAPARAVVEAPADPDVAPPRPGLAGSRLRVLLVEDHPANRQVVQLILAELVDLDVAVDGADGVAAARAKPYDVVLMDMQMPAMDGISATRAIRALEAELGRPRAAMVMLTANAAPEHVRQSREAGADAHLAKPITAKALLAAIEGVVATREEAQPAQTAVRLSS